MIKRISTFVLLAAVVSSCSAQKGYWQQEVEYKMNIDMDAEKHQFHGTSELTYVNNSPDTITKAFFHLYFNAFQPGSMMDVRSRSIPDPDPRVEDRISRLGADEIGYHKMNKVLHGGKPATYTVEGTIMEVILNKPLLPGKKATFELDYDSQVPVQIRRTGRDNKEGVEFSMTQWYPKLAEYDKDGWHSNPYIGREFHGIWGEFDVTINMDKKYLIGGTGYLQNPQEVGYGYEDASKPLKRPEGEKLTWHFNAPKVHDFAWAADPDFAHDTQKLSNGTVLHFIYQKDTLVENWKKLGPRMVESFNYVNDNFGEYPYKQYSFIQGGDGGMEYPMCTLITAYGSYRGLVSVSVHESIHSWYQGLLATNESKYEWMDEGFCSFAQYITMDHLYNLNQMNPLSRQYAGYIRLANTDKQEPLTTHADFYKLNGVYGSNAYSKGSVLVQQLGYVIGDEALMRGMKRYYYDWRFKHPTPQDFKRVMEKESGLELDWYFEQFVGTTNTIDYSISNVEEKNGSTEVLLTRVGDMPMPIDLVVTMNDGSVKWFYIPMRIMRGEKGKDMYGVERITKPDWPWVYPDYSLNVGVPLSQIKSIVIDPSTRLADIDQSNNIYPQKVDTDNIRFEGK